LARTQAPSERTELSQRVGIDVVPNSASTGTSGAPGNLRFEVYDARSFDGFEDMSLA
jgi:hypothetical protein